MCRQEKLSMEQHPTGGLMNLEVPSMWMHHYGETPNPLHRVRVSTDARKLSSNLQTPSAGWIGTRFYVGLKLVELRKISKLLTQRKEKADG